MIKGTTISGFDFEIDEEILDSWEYMEAVREADVHPLAIIDLAIMTLGTNQYNALKEHIRSKYGKLKIDVVKADIISVFNVKVEKN